MTDIQLYTKLSDLPTSLKKKVSDYIDALMIKEREIKLSKNRISGLGKDLISLNDNFNDPIEGFENYI